MASRISDLEKSLARARDERTSIPPTPNSGETLLPREGGPSSLPAFTPSTEAGDDLGQRPSEDVLVEKGASSQYFNEVLLSRVIEEVSAWNPCHPWIVD
jgi:hypothetical protein